MEQLRKLQQRLTAWQENHATRRAFESIRAEVGPNTLEIVENEWKGVSYQITHTDSQFTPWAVDITGIPIPSYDEYASSGPHNVLIQKVFTLMAEQAVRDIKGKEHKPHYATFPSHEKHTHPRPPQFLHAEVDDLSDGNRVARAIIEKNQVYKERLDAARKFIEEVYHIDPETGTSVDWGSEDRRRYPQGENLGEAEMEYPYPDDPRDVLPELRDTYGLDFIGTKANW